MEKLKSFFAKNKLADNIHFFNEEFLKENRLCYSKNSGMTIGYHNYSICRYLDNNVIPYKLYDIYKYCNYFNISYEEFYYNLLFIITIHDYGKSSKNWQSFIKKRMNGENIKTSHERHELNSFNEIFKNYNKLLYNIYNIENIIKNDKDRLNFCIKYYYIFIPIFAHHNKLSKNIILNYDFNGNEPKTPCKDKSLIDMIDCMTYQKGNSYELWYKQEIYRYLLSVGDKSASAKDDNYDINIPKFKDFDFKDLYKGNYREFQKNVLSHSNENILMVRQITGGGKTYASLLWGKYQIEHNFAKNIVLAMPTQFTSNSIGNDIKEFVSNSSVFHSKVKNTLSNIYDKYFYFNYIKHLESSVSVVTVDQLLYASTLNNEDYKVSFYNLINSCLIIDELDFYDSFTMSNIIQLLKICRNFNIKVLIMSATLPDKYVDIIQKESNENITILDGSVDDKSIRVDIKYYGNENNDILYNIIMEKKSLIIYVNTIDRANSVYDFVRKYRKDVIIYHSDLLQKDKNKTEEKIISMLGKKAWENNTANGVVIMTQIGELSLNISADTIITDVAPMDRLVQRFGRGCRFNGNICEIYVFKPLDDNGNIYYFPYAVKNSKNEIVPNIIFQRTFDILEEKKYSYNDYMDIINSIYYDFEIDKLSISNSKKILELGKYNKLWNFSSILGDLSDTCGTGDWRSRDIDEQVSIFINDELFLNKEEIKYESYKDFLIDKEIYSMQTRMKKIKRNFDKVIKKNIIVDDETITIYVVPQRYYHYENGDYKGLNFN